MYQIKISLPNYWTIVNASPNLTSLNLIELILDKYECPRTYAQVCIILVHNEQRKHVLSHSQKVQQFYKENDENTQYFFRVLFVPENQDIQKLHSNFLKLVQEQTQYFITQGIYNIKLNHDAQLCDYPPIVLAGYICAISHGKKARRHNKRFLRKIIDKILPQSLLTMYKSDVLCEAVLEVWGKVPVYQNITKNDYIFQYLSIAQASIKQFGSFVLIAKQMEKQTNAYFYLNKENIGIYDEGELYYDSYKKMFIDCDEGQIKVVYGDQYFKFTTQLNVQLIQNLIVRNQFYQSQYFKVDDNGFLPLNKDCVPPSLV